MFSDVSWQEMACDILLSFRARLQILKEILESNKYHFNNSVVERDH